MTDNYKFYAMDHSYYSGKVRPYLRYKGIPYKEIVSTLWVYKRVIIPRTGVRFIPVLQSPDDVVVQDTSDIIDFLEARFTERSIYPTSPRQRLAAFLFEVYADEWFLLPAMHYRWNFLDHHGDYLMGEFGRVAGNWLPAAVRRAVGRKFGKTFSGFVGPLGINDDTVPAIEAWYEQFLDQFNTHLEQHPYLLGSRPCIGDFALAGPLYAHLWLDPYPRQIMEAKAPAVVEWIRRINAQQQDEGEFLPDDQVPETLNPILQHFFGEHFPILADTVERLSAWLTAHPDKQYISRAIGEHQFRVGEAKSKRLVFPYSQWMLQRAVDCYRSVPADERESVDAWLETVGGREAMQIDIKDRVARRNNRLIAV